MKRAGELWPRIIDPRNILDAARAALRGKRYTSAALRFSLNLEREVLALVAELSSGHYRPGPYTEFWITRPKRRMISAAPFRDRVVHHALMRVVEPVFERGFIDDSYACRKGRGTRAALLRALSYARRFPYALKMDVRRYFPSIDHAILKGLIARKIKCDQTLELLGLIIDASNPQEPHVRYFAGDDLLSPWARRRGLPIGNLTSQVLANLYLDPLDHLVKERLRLPGYVRYVDDLLCFGPTRSSLRRVRDEIERKLADLRLVAHSDKTQLLPTARGVSFLGFRVRPTGTLLRTGGRARQARRVRYVQRQLRTGGLSLEAARRALVAMRAFSQLV